MRGRTPPPQTRGKRGAGAEHSGPGGGTWPRSRVGAGRGLGGRCPPVGVRGEGADPGAAPVSPPPQPPRHANALPLRLGTSTGTHTHTHTQSLGHGNSAARWGVGRFEKKKNPGFLFFFIIIIFLYYCFSSPRRIHRFPEPGSVRVCFSCTCSLRLPAMHRRNVRFLRGQRAATALPGGQEPPAPNEPLHEVTKACGAPPHCPPLPVSCQSPHRPCSGLQPAEKTVGLKPVLVAP